MTKIIIADDHALLRAGIKTWIENHSSFKVDVEAGTYEDCVRLAQSFESGKRAAKDYMAIVDISFKNDGAGAAQEENCGFEIIQKFSALGIACVAFSSHDTGGFVERTMSAAIGAKGFVSKNADENILLAALNAVSEGHTYVQAELVSGLLETRDISQTFTKKERMVADALTIKKSNAQVAKELGLSEKTVLNYLSALYDKTGVSSKVEFLERLGRL
ncbi:MAG: response regulator transcription factor [Treponema sp.]|nr:response regulator transcription factor [Treponema sp.]